MAGGRYARRFWSIERDFSRGSHRTSVRATDGRGQRQPLDHRPNRDAYAIYSVHVTEIVVL
jgi:hypothetical protein